MFSCLIYIGRFEPLHNGHLALIRAALPQTEKLLIFVGSHEACRSLRNPFTTQERIEMLSISLSSDELNKIIFIPIHDSNYNYPEWVKEAKEKVLGFLRGVPLGGGAGGTPPLTGIIGHKKDDTSYYLDLFPEWKLLEIPLLEEGVSSTEIREKWLGGFLTENDKVPQAVFNYLKSKENEQWFKDLKIEFEFVKDYRKSWAGSPYPPVFVAGDACVVYCCRSIPNFAEANSGGNLNATNTKNGKSSLTSNELQQKYVLLIKRAAFPGKGLYSLPGGFLEQSETIKHCAIRELLEETGIELSYKELENSITNCKIFDDPKREPRGRMISHCFLFELTAENFKNSISENSNNGNLPKLKASDDASSAMWFPLDDLDGIRSQIAGDHYKVIKSIAGKFF